MKVWVCLLSILCIYRPFGFISRLKRILPVMSLFHLLIKICQKECIWLEMAYVVVLGVNGKRF